jgi:protein TonB
MRRERRKKRDFLCALMLALAVHAGVIYVATRDTLYKAANVLGDEDGIFTPTGLYEPNVQPAAPQVSVPAPEMPMPPPLAVIPEPAPMLVPKIAAPVIASISSIPSFAVAAKAKAARARVSKVAPSPGAVATRRSGGGPGRGASGGSATGIRYLYNPRPAYPAEARARRQQGVVIMSVDISAAGRVVDAHVMRTSGFPLLDRAALAAVRSWVFAPASRGGVDVAADVEIPVRFSLSQ